MAAPVTIEAIRQLSSERIEIALSDGETLKGSISDLAELRLYRGQPLDEATLDTVRSACALSMTKARALDALSRRMLSARELEKKLLQKGEDERVVARCIRWLEDNRLLDDEAYAAAVARHYAAKGYGAGRIRSELSRRGLSRALWDDAIAQRPDNTKKMDAFIAARLHNPEDRDQVRKVSAALFRRGYGWDEIRTALARFRAEAPDEENG